MTISELIAQARVIRAQAEATAAAANALEAQLIAMAESVRKPAPDSPSPEKKEPAVSDDPSKCECPQNLRKKAATMGHPNRTVCRMCNKEHESW